MHDSRPPASHPDPSGALEFEITDFMTARAAHDALPPGIERVPELAPRYWESRRRRSVPTDRALAGSTIDWLLALPPSQRPKALCERFPRLANALAATWHDAAARRALLDGLLDDGRAQRTGFPLEVRREIEALRRS